MSINSTRTGGATPQIVVQIVNTQTGAVATGSTQIPADDTKPQNTEGDEYMTLAITPTSATNKLRIEVTVYVSCGTADRTIAVALFQDTTVDAIAACFHYQATATAQFPVVLPHYMIAGTTSATTFKVRIGPVSAAGTITLNGASGARYLGGVIPSNITITEIKA